jgi:penicillin amidase
VPFEEMPYETSPANGFLATANNKPVQDGGGPFLGADWLDGYRAGRISDALESLADWGIESSQELQMDDASLPWREIRALVLSVADANPASSRASSILQDWDGRVAADSYAATVYEHFLAEMTQRIAVAKAPNSWQWAVGKGFFQLAPGTAFGVRGVSRLVRLILDQPEGWFERGWRAEIADALGATMVRIEATFGRDPARWRWGRVRTLTLKHLFGDKRPLDRIFNLGPIPWGGDSSTPAQASVDTLNPCANPGFVASARMVVDVGAWENARYSLPGGQSGNPVSPHYADLFPFWRRGEGVPIAWAREEVRRASKELLRLTPRAYGG